MSLCKIKCWDHLVTSLLHMLSNIISCIFQQKGQLFTVMYNFLGLLLVLSVSALDLDNSPSNAELLRMIQDLNATRGKIIFTAV